MWNRKDMNESAVPSSLAGASPRGKKAARKAVDEELRMRQLCNLNDAQLYGWTTLW